LNLNVLYEISRIVFSSKKRRNALPIPVGTEFYGNAACGRSTGNTARIKTLIQRASANSCGASIAPDWEFAGRLNGSCGILYRSTILRRRDSRTVDLAGPSFSRMKPDLAKKLVLFDLDTIVSHQLQRGQENGDERRFVHSRFKKFRK